MTPWHRLFGRLLADLYAGTSYRVEIERDLSSKQQFLDVAVVALQDDAPFMAPHDPPTGSTTWAVTTSSRSNPSRTPSPPGPWANSWATS